MSSTSIRPSSFISPRGIVIGCIWIGTASDESLQRVDEFDGNGFVLITDHVIEKIVTLIGDLKSSHLHMLPQKWSHLNNVQHIAAQNSGFVARIRIKPLHRRHPRHSEWIGTVIIILPATSIRRGRARSETYLTSGPGYSQPRHH